jgi:hypothetical protein
VIAVIGIRNLAVIVVAWFLLKLEKS